MASSTSCSCLVIVTAYAAVISLAFVIMTVLYSTQGSVDCGATVFSGDSKQAVSAKVTHFDILNMEIVKSLMSLLMKKMGNRSYSATAGLL